jgi:hypothetical protein
MLKNPVTGRMVFMAALIAILIPVYLAAFLTALAAVLVYLVGGPDMAADVLDNRVFAYMVSWPFRFAQWKDN